MMLFQPITSDGTTLLARLIDATTEREVTEAAYLETRLKLYNDRNPHATLSMSVDAGT